MTVKNLKELLAIEPDESEVLVSLKIPNFEPERIELEIAGLRQRLNPDTAVSELLIECHESGI